jgi:hypothetical protein
VKFVPSILAALLLAGCNRGTESKEAVRQAVIDYLSTRKNLNVSSMNVEVSSVTFRKDEADAMVSVTPKGSSSGGPQSMTIPYKLERQGSRWVVKTRGGSQENPHGGAAPQGGMQGEAPGAANPADLPPGHPPVSGDGKK